MPRRKIRLMNQEVRREVDTTTGEVFDTVVKKQYSISVKSEEFFMTFVEFMGPIYMIKYADDFKVLGKMCQWAKINTGEVDLTSKKRSQMMVELGLGSSQISRSLKRLKDLDLIRGDGGTYEIAHEIFWKGGMDERDTKNLRRKIEVEFRTVSGKGSDSEE